MNKNWLSFAGEGAASSTRMHHIVWGSTNTNNKGSCYKWELQYSCGGKFSELYSRYQAGIPLHGGKTKGYVLGFGCQGIYCRKNGPTSRLSHLKFWEPLRFTQIFYRIFWTNSLANSSKHICFYLSCIGHRWSSLFNGWLPCSKRSWSFLYGP